MIKNIIALEGPAGSGKTTTLREIEISVPGFTLLHRPEHTIGPRSYSNEAIPIEADFQRVQEAIYSPEENFISDRFWISSMVYQPFKGFGPDYVRPQYYPGKVLVHGDIAALGLWLTGLIRGANCRDFSLTHISRVYLTFYVLMPTEEFLRGNRKFDGREYPFDGKVELAYYENYCWNFEPWDNKFVKIDLRSFRLYSPDDYGLVLARAKQDRKLKTIRRP